VEPRLKDGHTLCRTWDGEALEGWWEVTIKIDGVRAFLSKDGAISRNGKPLYNLEPHWRGLKKPRDVEVYCGSFKETITRVRASTKERPISADQLFDLEPLDPRLDGGLVDNPTPEAIKRMLKRLALDKGYEGLVLRKGNLWIKVKPLETYDVVVTGVIAGEGKHEGRLGALKTPMGNVGTGFSDEMREELWGSPAFVVGETIEVECMQLTPAGMFRHPRFVRMRYDK